MASNDLDKHGNCSRQNSNWDTYLVEENITGLLLGQIKSKNFWYLQFAYVIVYRYILVDLCVEVDLDVVSGTDGGCFPTLILRIPGITGGPGLIDGYPTTIVGGSVGMAARSRNSTVYDKHARLCLQLQNTSCKLLLPYPILYIPSSSSMIKSVSFTSTCWTLRKDRITHSSSDVGMN